MTLHPQGKSGVHILKRRYGVIKDFIKDKIEKAGEVSYQDLNDMAAEDCRPRATVKWFGMSSLKS